MTDPPSLGDGGHLPESDVHADGVAVVQDVDSFVVEGNHHLGQRHARTHHLGEKGQQVKMMAMIKMMMVIMMMMMTKVAVVVIMMMMMVVVVVIIIIMMMVVGWW